MILDLFGPWQIHLIIDDVCFSSYAQLKYAVAAEFRVHGEIDWNGTNEQNIYILHNFVLMNTDVKNSDRLNVYRGLFWDFDYEKINWQASYRTIIERVVERGNPEDWQELIHFYGKEKIIATLKNEIKSLLSDKKSKLTYQIGKCVYFFRESCFS
jgi:uncharacterized protein DUF6922